MADQHPNDDPALAQAARHALHDEELVAAFAADPDGAEDPARAKALIDRCATCASIAADIATIAGAVRSLGAAEALAGTIRAPRDFRLTAEDAARLGPVPVSTAASTPAPTAGPAPVPAATPTPTPVPAAEPVPAQLSMTFEAEEGPSAPAAPAQVPERRPEPEPARPGVGFLAGLAALLRPLGATLATFGLVGLLVGTVSLGPMGGSTAMSPEGDGDFGGPAPAATTGAAAAPGEQPAATLDTRQEVSPLASVPGVRQDDATEPLTATTTVPTTALLLGGSALAVVLGVALFVAGSRAIRRTNAARGG